MRTASALLTFAACVLVAWHGWHCWCEVRVRYAPLVSDQDAEPLGGPSESPEFRFGFSSWEVRWDDSESYTEVKLPPALRLRFAGFGYIAVLGLTGVLLAFQRLRVAPLCALAGLLGFLYVAVREVPRAFGPVEVEHYEFAPTWSSIVAGSAWGLALALAWLAPRRGRSPDARAEVFE